jgi:FkbM family methyltransferase
LGGSAVSLLQRAMFELTARVRVRLGRAVRVTYGGYRYYINPESAAAYHARESIFKIGALADLVAKDARVVIDVGANCGLFSAMVASRLPNARVIAFEPSLDLVPFIERNCLDYAVTVEQAAVSDIDGLAMLHVNAASQQTNSLQADAVTAVGSVTETRPVRCVSLDRYVADHDIEYVDVLKIDVQGGEGAVLRGARQVVEGVQQLFIESTWLDPESMPGVISLGLRYGFTHLSVVNSVYLGADLMLSRSEPRGHVIACHQLSAGLLTAHWLGT